MQTDDSCATAEWPIEARSRQARDGGADGQLGQAAPVGRSVMDIVRAKRQHAARLANESGASGEAGLLANLERWQRRPRGRGLKVLMAALRSRGIAIKASSFDAVSAANGKLVDFTDPALVEAVIDELQFLEIKTASQSRVREDFAGFFFALTENEIAASDILGQRHHVALYNKNTGSVVYTSIPEILARAKSTTWQVSVQL